MRMDRNCVVRAIHRQKNCLANEQTEQIGSEHQNKLRKKFKFEFNESMNDWQ